MRLYDYLPSGNGYKVRLLLAHLGIPFERIEVDILKGESRTPEFLAKNPNGRIPLLEWQPGIFLAESDAILFFLADGTPFAPRDRLERARVLEWMFFEQYSHEPNIATVRFWITHLGLNEERRAQLEPKRTLGYAALGVMERHLESRQFFVGDRYSIADIALYAYTHVAHEGGFELGRFPAILAWLGRVARQPGHIPITRG
ncbi:MAG: glutathione S-transferase family protein [Deltaproteobacteria bacterium]|nr:MAG: glutathione S-transferase family protein [Deltaproteobacteria bacterium]